MSPRVFITGATGYVGGQTAVTLIAAHPEYDVVALVRDQEQADKLKSRFPKISTVIGTLDDDAVLKEEAAKADVVLRKSATASHCSQASSKSHPLILSYLHRNRQLRPRSRSELPSRRSSIRHWKRQIHSHLRNGCSQRYVYWTWKPHFKDLRRCERYS